MSNIRLVMNLNEIEQNIATIDKYLASGTQEEREYTLKLITRGICFVAVKTDDSYKFYPSRFIGYYHNSMIAHTNNLTKDGKMTRPQIEKILHQKYVPNDELEKAYIKYCRSLKISPNSKGAYGGKRKYLEL